MRHCLPLSHQLTHMLDLHYRFGRTLKKKPQRNQGINIYTHQSVSQTDCQVDGHTGRCSGENPPAPSIPKWWGTWGVGRRGR